MCVSECFVCSDPSDAGGSSIWLNLDLSKFPKSHDLCGSIDPYRIPMRTLNIAMSSSSGELFLDKELLANGLLG